MILFKKKPAQVPNEATAQKIANGIISRQRQLATFLNARINSMPRKPLLALFGLLWLFSGSYFLYLLIKCFLK